MSQPQIPAPAATHQRIIVCGYPKSGNTWLTRLTAEIIRCPVAGFWCEPLNKEEAIEGLDRVSPYRCFKAHHTITDLRRTFTHYANGNERVIYVVRDPRDVVVSGSYFFKIRMPRYRALHALMSISPLGARAYGRLCHTPAYRRRVMTSRLLNGEAIPGPTGAWLGVPWKTHVAGYLDSGVLVIRYEDLLSDPLGEARRLCAYLNVDREDDALRAAIDRQSFEARMKASPRGTRPGITTVLRRGTSGEWKTSLHPTDVERIHEELGPLMVRLGYELP